MNILSIAGSDPSSGAGIQSDLKTFDSLDCYGFSVITAVTSQNTKKFVKNQAILPQMITSQIESILSDFRVDAIKIGMVYNSGIIKAIVAKLKKSKTPIIIDPVFKSTTGGILLEKTALADFKKLLLPLSYVITPNVSEAEKITNIKIRNKDDLQKCAKKIIKLGAKNVVITGFEFKNSIADFAILDSKEYFLSGKKISLLNHGSGCNYSASLAVSIAKGKSLYESVLFAKKFATDSIKNSIKIGKGIRITSKNDKTQNELKKSIREFVNFDDIYKFVPECQTNFVFAKAKPKTTKHIMGIKGRIVKAGTNVIVAGDLEYGGSKHVATAVVGVSKKFPQIKSALNIKYDEKTIQKCKKNDLVVSSYNRKSEPKKNKSSIEWGIKQAIKNSKTPPDVIFHKGDVGKEPMILIFGRAPSNVLSKLRKII